MTDFNPLFRLGLKWPHLSGNYQILIKNSYKKYHLIKNFISLLTILKYVFLYNYIIKNNKAVLYENIFILILKILVHMVTLPSI